MIYYKRGDKMKKIMVVEDDISIREELCELLRHAQYEVVSLEDFACAKEMILESEANLVLLDINLPKMNGEWLLKEIRKESNVPIIMVTSRIREVDEVLSMSYGADDYITKPYNPTILLLRIENIFRRMEQVQDFLEYDDIKVNPNKGTLNRGEEELALTKNEMLIFIHLLRNRGRIVTRDDLMTDLWNNNEYINDNALTVNISRLRSKLESFHLFNAIETRKGQGYRLL